MTLKNGGLPCFEAFPRNPACQLQYFSLKHYNRVPPHSFANLARTYSNNSRFFICFQCSKSIFKRFCVSFSHIKSFYFVSSLESGLSAAVARELSFIISLLCNCYNASLSGMNGAALRDFIAALGANDSQRRGKLDDQKVTLLYHLTITLSYKTSRSNRIIGEAGWEKRNRNMDNEY